MDRQLSEQHRIIAFGDIHGCRRTLAALLEQLDPEPSDQLVFLGDVIDRGSNSRGVIDDLITLADRYRCFFVMGNHELLLLESLETGDSSLWLDNGGSATLSSYHTADSSGLPQNHIDFLRSFNYYIESDTFIFVHGGLDPEMSVRDNIRFMQPSDFCWMRTHLRRSFLETGRYQWEKTVVCGHTPMPEVINQKKLISLDTGCVYTDTPSLGRLSAVVLPERRIVQTGNIDT
ncbi:serine/threonine protein phosphatase [Prosthecochloris sp. ZM_2]|uniref:metallophosphoesterase family protein n=1 Tax=Prosthecochloris sp. ZM_2 TaxID=2045206 RepID=UPI000DF763B8|nr:metallophosphoesterase family protein [Prosthecochloris sp. ZM_2]RNA64370.1 serine/threonine protein phosphatase [Prosthecochloris sp. ZM_2]